MYTESEKLVPINIEDELKTSYLNYSMSVIVGRALPDARDGLKPVHRRILYAMRELSLEHNKAYKKSARIVGEVLGKYHPHGDTAVYDALVRMVQDFSLRYPLVDGQGNFGSVDGDSPAAMRYTEARMSRITGNMLKDLEKNTVKFTPNFDESLKEPVVLPTALPNMLINGASGIAVGMATNIPPHNLGEICDAIIYLIDNPNAEIKDLMKIVKGPDFPTGGTICGKDGIKSAYQTGRGRVRLHAKSHIETLKNGKESVIITEIPYQVNKTTLIESFAKLVQSKKIEGISDIRDESDKSGMRIVIEVRKNQNAEVVLNKLYQYTQMRTTFGIIMLALVNNRPKVLTLKEMLSHFIDHRKEIITNRTKFDLEKALDRAHILEGLKIALDKLDLIIKTIRSSKTPLEAKTNLVKKFKLSERQAQAILEMQLQKLTGLERDKIEAEYLEIIKKIEMYKAILASEKKVLEIIQKETEEIKETYADPRRTNIIAAEKDFQVEDLIAEEDMVIVITHSGYIKRLSVSAYRKQKRGGVGVTGSNTKTEDFVEHLFIASTHDYILVFTDKGKVYWLKTHEIPEASRTARGKAIINLISHEQNEKVTSLVRVREFKENEFLVMATARGIIKKTRLIAFSKPRKGGILAIGIDKDDKLIGVKRSDGKATVFIATSQGKAIHFPEKDVREMGRQAAGVRAMKLNKDDIVIGMNVVLKKEGTFLTVTERGYGKRTEISEYRLQSRGGKGIINIKVTQKNGKVVALQRVEDKNNLMMITQKGMVIKCPVQEIRETGRAAQGVRLINIKDDSDKVVAAAKIAGEEDIDNSAENNGKKE